MISEKLEAEVEMFYDMITCLKREFADDWSGELSEVLYERERCAKIAERVDNVSNCREMRAAARYIANRIREGQ